MLYSSFSSLPTGEVLTECSEDDSEITLTQNYYYLYLITLNLGCLWQFSVLRFLESEGNCRIKWYNFITNATTLVNSNTYWIFLEIKKGLSPCHRHILLFCAWHFEIQEWFLSCGRLSLENCTNRNYITDIDNISKNV